jgi:hypothetical protein
MGQLFEGRETLDRYPGTRVPLSASIEAHIEDAKRRGFNAFGIETRNSTYLIMEMLTAVVSVVKVGETPHYWDAAVLLGNYKLGDWWEIQTTARDENDVEITGEFLNLFFLGQSVFRSSRIRRKIGLSEGQTRCSSFLERNAPARIA